MIMDVYMTNIWGTPVLFGTWGTSPYLVWLAAVDMLVIMLR